MDLGIIRNLIPFLNFVLVFAIGHINKKIHYTESDALSVVMVTFE